MLETQLARFTPKTSILASGCIVWTGVKTHDGYGQIRINGRMRYAHRVAYEHWVGPIPEGMEPDHLCRNNSCVNVTHLEVVTGFVNRSRSKRPDQTKCAAGLHDWVDENLYRSASGRAYCKPCNNAKSHRYYERRRDA